MRRGAKQTGIQGAGPYKQTGIRLGKQMWRAVEKFCAPVERRPECGHERAGDPGDAHTEFGAEDGDSQDGGKKGAIFEGEQK